MKNLRKPWHLLLLSAEVLGSLPNLSGRRHSSLTSYLLRAKTELVKVRACPALPFPVESSTGLEVSVLKNISPFCKGDQHLHAQLTSIVIWYYLAKDKEGKPGVLVSEEEEEGHPSEPQGPSNLGENQVTFGRVEFQTQVPEQP